MDAVEQVRILVGAGDGMTRADLAAELGLPLGTVTTAVTRLLREGAVAERTAAHPDPAALAPATAATTARAGRPPTLVVPSGPPRTVGTVIWTYGRVHAAVATYGGTVLTRADIEVSGDFSTPEVLAPAWRFLADAAAESLDRVVLGVPAPFQRGVGMPPGRLPVPETPAGDGTATATGPGTGTGTRAQTATGSDARRPGYASWLTPDPAAALAERLGVDVLIENDANLGAIGEAHAGAGRGHRCQIYLKLGERSVGAGLILDGALYRGASGYAGEIAHVHVDDGGPLCVCGGRGCLAMTARGPLLELMENAYTEPLSFADVLSLADADEPAPARVLREVGRILGRPLADLCTFLNPEVVILDGTLGGAGRHVLSGLREQIERYCAPAVAASLTLAPGTLGLDADVLGAVRLARSEALARIRGGRARG